jgi:hypothetical protein
MCRGREAGRVTEDATLDEFAPDDGESADGGGESGQRGGDGGGRPEPGGGDGGQSEQGGNDGGSDPGGDAAVEPAVSTYRSALDGRACDGCGGSVTELWRDGDALVCPDCKQWEQ